MKKTEPKEHSTRKIVGKKSQYKFFDEYFDYIQMKPVPISDGRLLEIASEVVKWALEDEGAITLSQFYCNLGIALATFQKWRRRCPELEEGCTIAKQIIGNRREKGALERRYAERTVLTSMAQYSPSWKKMEEWRSSLKVKEHSASRGDIKIVMESYPKTDVVPEKKDDISNASEVTEDKENRTSS